MTQSQEKMMYNEYLGGLIVLVSVLFGILIGLLYNSTEKGILYSGAMVCIGIILLLVINQINESREGK